ncbi:NADH-quinone oxidoreductase subunit A [Paraglaciecola polaris]|uniref:NADH-quinone oxidoreductase subunit A n=1 Tax=Paraglaciecola polaris LMG 21857 TaxID=1129793 RepID=K7A0Y0_9ALTE|nr:NADH-quinone oxidoreductase subunit A [Paraglaciecola polaris]GAC34618.1 NADH-quinone oxidoreductase subunit A [Paraglaciecola polaris LMG 21857]|tara:strand:+ start:6669 stop:7058 length:390 start_codon:yes stop_codon:yes gene_type:complete
MEQALVELWPILLYFAFTLVLLGGVMLVSTILGPRTRGHSTHLPYESGILPLGNARVKFANHFFLYAIFFVIFDLETLFLFAWAISFEQVGVTGFIEALVFILILLIALVYLWRIGALNIRKRHLPEQN